MGKIAIMTDSNSGITPAQAEELGIFVMPMPFCVGDKQYLEGISLSAEEFYSSQEQGINITTSQPSAHDITEFWDKILETHDQILHIPMSKALSGTFETAYMQAKKYEGKVVIVDNQRISATQRQSVLDAMELLEAGETPEMIKERLEREGKNSSIYLTVDDLGFLRRGGRITAAGAAIGSVLNVKPVLQIQGGKLDAYAKARGMKQAKKVMLEAMRRDLETRFFVAYEKKAVHISVVHSNTYEAAKEFAEEIKQEFPEIELDDIYIDNISLSVACHTGPGTLAITCSVKI